MGILSSRSKEKGITVFSKEIYIKGKIKIDTNVFIEGVVEGDIISTSHITIGKQGKVMGSITADKLVVNGYVKGSVKANSVELLEGSISYLEIESDDLSIESGARFHGNNKIKIDQETSIKVEYKEFEDALPEEEKIEKVEKVEKVEKPKRTKKA